ncbi:hypothetical protein MKX01_025728, partial [Papaver californicum]
MINDDHWYDTWDKVIDQDDGYVHLWCNISDRKFPPGDGWPSSYGHGNMYQTPTKVRRDTITCIGYANSPVRLDPD